MAAEQDVNDFTDSAFSGMDITIRRDPQATYAQMRAAGPVARVGDARVVVSTLEASNEVLRHPEVYSSLLTAGHLGNIRPLIPIELDPPEQRKFRKILDPLFTPKHLEYLNEPLEKLINELIDGFIDEREIDFAERFSVPFPSQVFLTMFGLPLEERPKFLAMKNGIIRPFDVLGVSMNDPRAMEYRDKSVQSIYDYFNEVLDEREKDLKDDLLSGFIDRQGRRRPPDAGGHPRHLLPAADRRPGYGVGVAGLLLPLSRRTPRGAGQAHRRSRPQPAGRGRTAPLGVTRAVGGPRRHAGHRVDGLPDPRRGHRQPLPRLSQHGRGRLPQPRPSRLGPKKPTATSPSAEEIVDSSDPTWRALSFASHCGSGTAASRTTASSPAQLDYGIGVRSVASFPMILGESA